ncbi:MAG TPA: putative glycolipid-binding domain-containing protein [Candidatus Dormibacteraeota bacterium]|nr:putative glycolipid-binding domain-containing protein [Candidatus Dormibacteraeota bacterium]
MSEVMWRREDGGVEHVVVSVAAGGGVDVDGVVVWPGDRGEAHRVRYTLRCDSAWRVRELRAEAPEDGTMLHVHADGEGSWRSFDSVGLPHLDGCVDVDLYAVVFTNTLPVRRLGLEVGESRAIDVAYVRLPSMAVERMQQRYTRVAADVYRYQSVASGFTADLRVDAGGLVVDYPGLARRMWAR